MKHKGYNNVTNGGNASAQKFKTYQGQKLDDELGLNWLSFKYRNYDPAIARFFNVDPLAKEYAYNSPYAFQENKLGLGVELEGLELFERVKNGITQFFTGANDLAKKSVQNSVKAKFENAKTSKPNAVEDNQQKSLMDTSKALGEMGTGIIETAKGSAQVIGTTLENTGDLLTAGGIATGFAPLAVAGEILSTTGTGINVGVDLSDGKSLTNIAIERLPSLVIGGLGKAATKSVIKNSSKIELNDGTTKKLVRILDGKTFVTDKIIIPAVTKEIKNK